MSIYLQFEATTSGKSKGECGENDRKGWSLVLDAKYGAEAPTDSTLGGGHTAEVQHKPVEVVILTDPASVQLHLALVKSEVLKTVKIEWTRRNKEGKREIWKTVDLKNAVVKAFEQFQEQGSTQAHETRSHTRVSFVFEDITVTHNIASVTSQHNWRDRK
jgi:type VI secretion system secreted protein Hcp